METEERLAFKPVKHLFLSFVFLLLFGPNHGQNPVFTVRYSEPLAVFMFVKKLMVNAGDNPFKAVFTKSDYNTQKYTNLVAQLDTLQLDYTYPYTEFPYGSKIPGMTEALLKKHMIASASIGEFKMRSIGLIPNTSLNALSEALSAFAPVYNTLIFNPNKAKFEEQLGAIAEFMKSKNVATYFEAGARFYNSAWDNTVPFEIAFYPLPNAKGFTAEAFYNNAVSAIQTDLTDYNVLLSVVLHEIFHILYDEQSLAVKKELYKAVQQNPAKCSVYAYQLMNEVLATALGNGYAYEKLNGKVDLGEWYNWPYINTMAKQIYPLVCDYLEQKKAMDKNFMNAYIRLYGQANSNWLEEARHTMTYRYILSTNREDLDAFWQVYPYCSLSEAEDEITKSSIEHMKRTPLTKVIVVSENHAACLALIKASFPELKDWRYKSGAEFTHRVFLSDKTQLYIVNRQKTATATLIRQL